MPNVIRKVTRATMVKQYLQFCEEEKFEPLGRATLFRVLEVREASQQKSLSGLDNIAADGSAGFERLNRIVDELNQIGLKKDVADEFRGTSKRNTKVTATIMKVNAPTTAVTWVSVIRRIQISRNIVHTNMRFAALNVTTSLCVCRRCTKLSKMAQV